MEVRLTFTVPVDLFLFYPDRRELNMAAAEALAGYFRQMPPDVELEDLTETFSALFSTSKFLRHARPIVTALNMVYPPNLEGFLDDPADYDQISLEPCLCLDIELAVRSPIHSLLLH